MPYVCYRWLVTESAKVGAGWPHLLDSLRRVWTGPSIDVDPSPDNGFRLSPIQMGGSVMSFTGGIRWFRKPAARPLKCAYPGQPAASLGSATPRPACGAPMIEVKTLGRCLIQRDGRELAELQAQKQPCALLLHLAIEGSTSRDCLLTMFWPDRAAEKARHTLSQALYSLRRDLGEASVDSRGNAVRIACPEITIDALELEAAASRGDWERVVELYDGPFLDQFSLPGVREFEDWCSRSRTKLARTAHRAFGQMVRRRAASGDLVRRPSHGPGVFRGLSPTFGPRAGRRAPRASRTGGWG